MAVFAHMGGPFRRGGNRWVVLMDGLVLSRRSSFGFWVDVAVARLCFCGCEAGVRGLRGSVSLVGMCLLISLPLVS